MLPKWTGPIQDVTLEDIKRLAKEYIAQEIEKTGTGYLMSLDCFESLFYLHMATKTAYTWNMRGAYMQLVMDLCEHSVSAPAGSNFPYIRLRDMRDWVTTNCKGFVGMVNANGGAYYFFSDATDAVMFKMHFSE